MKKINLIFYNLNNYGDALNPLLFNELTGVEIQNKDYIPTIFSAVKIGFKYISTLDKSIIDATVFPWQKTIVGIGSIIRMSNKRACIWGSGFMNETERCKGGTVYAVRGKLTSEKLVDQGFPLCDVYGDPALLLPLFIPAQKANIKIALIPHYKEVDYFIKNYGDRYHIINLKSRDVERITKEIASCEYVLSTSLHGLIVAHAYQIPALWIKHGYIDTDGFKFYDYFSSVGIPFYDGIENINTVLENESNWRDLFSQYSDMCLINIDLDSLQSRLLKAFPYTLKEEYRKMIK